MKKIGTISNVIVLLMSAVLCIGVKTVFKACGTGQEGKWMACHWAEQAVMGIGISLTVTALMLVIVSNKKIKQGLALAMIPQAAVSACIPNTLINLCMMETMHCHTVTKPAVIIISVIIAVSALISVFTNKE
jgi:hypothetical protein